MLIWYTFFQVIGFAICHHNLPYDALDGLINDALDALHKIGFSVKVITMDQEATQWKWVNW